MNQQQWEARRASIGASDTPKIIGLSAWGGPADVWADKTGRTQYQPSTGAALRGQALESVVLAHAAEAHGAIAAEQERCAFPGWPILTATLDAALVDGRIVEAKTATYRHRDAWDYLERHGTPAPGTTPEVYWAQCQHQMLASGNDSVVLVVLLHDFDAVDRSLNEGNAADWAEVFHSLRELGALDFRSFEIRADAEFQRNMVASLRGFWRYVEDDVCPPGHAPSWNTLRAMWPAELTDREMQGDATAEAWIAHYLDSHAAAAAAEAAKEEAKRHLCALIGENRGLRADSGRATWKADKRGNRRFRCVAEQEDE